MKKKQFIICGHRRFWRSFISGSNPPGLRTGTLRSGIARGGFDMEAVATVRIEKTIRFDDGED